jgi:hypothetical protein
MKKTNVFNDIITNFSPVIEKLIRNLCKDLDNEDKTNEMLEKYLYDDKIKTLKNLVQKKQKNIRKKTSYSMFLAHNNIRKTNEKLTLKEYNLLKGKYWKTISVEEKDSYQKRADEWNLENMPYKMGKVDQLKKKKVKLKVQQIEKKTDNDLLDGFFDDTSSQQVEQQIIEEI